MLAMRGLIDSTLREGEQMAGVYFRFAEKLEFVQRLAEIGVEEIELANPLADPDTAGLLNDERAASCTARFSIWCRACSEDVVAAAELRPDAVAIAVPASDLHIRQKFGRDRSWVIERLGAVVRQAVKEGIPYVSVGFEDATRADPFFLHRLAAAAAAAGARRIRLSDTVGIATPLAFASLVQEFVSVYGMEVGVHTHNDFGMATANAVSALDAGTGWADGSLLGLGERAGCARLEELAAFVAILRHWRTYDLAGLRELCGMVAHAAHQPVERHHPVVGEGIFTCESGIHIDGLSRDPSTYEPYPPERVGAEWESRLGKKAGRNAVRVVLREIGRPVSAERAAELAPVIRSAAHDLGRPLTPAELSDLAEAVPAGSQHRMPGQSLRISRRSRHASPKGSLRGVL